MTNGVKIPLKDLRDLEKRFPGIFQRFIEAGQVQGTVLAMERDAFDRLNKDFFDGVKLGTFVKVVLSPVVRAIDRVTGTDLSHCAGCAGRELRLNALSS